MKTIAITAGFGNPFEEWARKLSDRINWLAGLVDDGIRCMTLKSLPDDIPHPNMVGGWMWDQVPDDVERVLWLDCDIVVMSPLRLSDMPEGRFCAVRDLDSFRDKSKKVWPTLEPVEHYFNSGMYLATRATVPVFEEYKRIARTTDPKTRKYPDQDLLNYLVWRRYASARDPAGWVEMPKEWNVLVWRYKPPRARIVHFAGVHNREWEMNKFFRKVYADDYWLESMYRNAEEPYLSSAVARWERNRLMKFMFRKKKSTPVITNC